MCINIRFFFNFYKFFIKRVSINPIPKVYLIENRKDIFEEIITSSNICKINPQQIEYTVVFCNSNQFLFYLLY